MITNHMTNYLLDDATNALEFSIRVCSQNVFELLLQSNYFPFICFLEIKIAK